MLRYIWPDFCKNADLCPILLVFLKKMADFCGFLGVFRAVPCFVVDNIVQDVCFVICF